MYSASATEGKFSAGLAIGCEASMSARFFSTRYSRRSDCGLARLTLAERRLLTA